MKKNGFTLIELLAVIIILGILMIIAIPSVTTYINNSRKSAYVDTAKEVIVGARNVVNEGKLEMYDTSVTYYIPSKYIKIEGGEAKSPYGNLTEAYVGVVYDGKGYKYYWISRDDTGQGFDEIISNDKLEEDSINSDIEESYVIDLVKKTGIGNRPKIKILNDVESWDDFLAEKYVIEDDIFTEEYMCPGCVYLRSTTLIRETFPVGSTTVNDYKQLDEYTTKPFYGVNLDKNNNISKIKVCMINGEKLFCSELEKNDNLKDDDLLTSILKYYQALVMNFLELKNDYGNSYEDFSTGKDGCYLAWYSFIISNIEKDGQSLDCITGDSSARYSYLSAFQVYLKNNNYKCTAEFNDSTNRIIGKCSNS